MTSFIPTGPASRYAISVFMKIISVFMKIIPGRLFYKSFHTRLIFCGTLEQGNNAEAASVTASMFKAMTKLAKGATAKKTDAATIAAKQTFVLLKRIAEGNFTGINPNIILIGDIK
jgi:hypothetical protein